MRGGTGAGFITTQRYVSPLTDSWRRSGPFFPPDPPRVRSAQPTYNFAYPDCHQASRREALPVRTERHNPHSIATLDRKSTRLNSSHLGISYAVFCLKKKQYKGPCFAPSIS